jgi:predicted polyphosphate/ATP-dependent NAD kinase
MSPVPDAMHPRRDIGLVVNPCAGAGGPAGVHGTDTPAQQAAARALGYVSAAPQRAVRALRELQPQSRWLRVWTGPGELGQDAAAALFPDVQVCAAGAVAAAGERTRRTVAQILGRGVELLLFVGGDGTARDVLAAARGTVPVIGIPCGASMQSGVFAAAPEAAGQLALAWLRGECRVLREQEVLGRAGLAPGAADMTPLAYGRLRMPYDRELCPGPKVVAPPPAAERDAVVAAVVDMLRGDDCVVLGPGSTKLAALATLGLAGSLPGVDIVRRGRLLASDAGETQLLGVLDHHGAARLIVTPLGGQGFLFGRGNQPLSARVIRSVGVENVTVIATPAKLHGLGGRPLRMDLDDADLPRHFPLNLRVITGPGRHVLYPFAP